MSSSKCCFLTCIQVSQEAGQVVWNPHLFQNFPQFIVTHTVKGFGIVSKAEMDVFLELSCFLDDPADVGNLISGSSAFSKTSLNIWNFTVHVLLKPGLENLKHYFSSMWDECSHVFGSLKKQKIPEKHLLLPYWLCQSLRLYRSQQTVENLTCLLRNLYLGQEATVRMDMELQTGSRKGVCQGCILSPC